MPITQTDLTHLYRTLELAKAGTGYVSPNPLVGCVVVSSNGRTLGEGAHLKFGEAHAEVNAIHSAEQAGQTVEGATLYVNLEPCNHTGKTPPCTDLILSKRIARVVVSMVDPNPLVSGKGIERLRKAGVVVEIGGLESEARRLNRFFIKHITTGRPYVTLKIAASIDGKTALQSGVSKWITSPESRKIVHDMRAEHDAVLVGWSTVLHDDPSLTVRDAQGRDPLRIVLDKDLEIAGQPRKLLNDGAAGRTRIVTTTKTLESKTEEVDRLKQTGATIIDVAEREGRLDLDDLLSELSKSGVASILVEPGQRLATSMVKANLADELVFFFAPKLLGADARGAIGPLGLDLLDRAPEFTLLDVERVAGSQDIRVRYLRPNS
jgi:diaminohydroxyphosphoribosylaminopyrimidine deaminase / 5-amino-6-(5-phosphoribosylamino)uracil reductase